MQLSAAQLWDFSFVAHIHKNVDLVRNNLTGQLMVRRLSSIDSYPVLSRLCSVRQPNLMEVYDVNVRDGICVSICEYVNGTTLEYNVKNIRPYTVSESKNILCQICDGLSALHQNGIVHRDIKPENIIIDNYGKVKIIDYGITRLIKPLQSKDTVVMGTAGYASPEQFGFSQTSGKADIYACGVLLNYLLTGKLPNEQMYQGALTTVIQKCIEIDENKRYRSAAELKKVLQGRIINSRRPMQPLPGFRSNHVLPKILTVIFIIMWCLWVLVEINSIPLFAKYSLETKIQQGTLSVDLLVFWTALPYILFGDMFRLSEKINPDNPQNGKYVLKILGAASIFFGILLMFAAQEITSLL